LDPAEGKPQRADLARHSQALEHFRPVTHEPTASPTSPAGRLVGLVSRLRHQRYRHTAADVQVGARGVVNLRGAQGAVRLVDPEEGFDALPALVSAGNLREQVAVLGAAGLELPEQGL